MRHGGIFGQATYAGLEGPPQAVAKQWRREPEPRKARNKIGKSFLKQNICPKSKYRPKEEKNSQDIFTQTANATASCKLSATQRTANKKSGRPKQSAAIYFFFK